MKSEKNPITKKFPDFAKTFKKFSEREKYPECKVLNSQKILQELVITKVKVALRR